MPAQEPDQAGALAPGARVGRFVVVRRAGAGGMGVVYEARDPELDRAVALKVLPPGRGDQHALRLLREAQALAQLAHPNVVAVYDVGVADERVFIAMEFVDGVTLDEHLRGRRASWRELLGLFAQAGRGLAAAHARSIVHRDFKPSNVFVDGDGRVRVGDFGLARVLSDSQAGGPARPVPAGSSSATTVDDDGEPPPIDEQNVATDPAELAAAAVDLLAAPLTAAGAFLGTPRYMAPEQRAREPATARSDQYAFCVAFWEALFGGLPAERGADGRAPGWLARTLATGLAEEPAARHPSMAALLERLERGLARRQRLRSGAAALLFAGGAAAATLLWRGGGGVDCRRAGTEAAAVWTPQARARVEAAFAAARPYGAESARRVSAALDDYVAGWRAARGDACRATHERGDQSAALLDRRTACLDEGVVALRALVAGLTTADGEAVDRAADAVAALPAADGCSAARVSASAPASADPRAVRIREQLAAIRADAELGRIETAQRLADAALADARALGDPGLRSQALAEHGLLLIRTDAKAGRAELEEALADAARAGDRAGEANVAVVLLDTVTNEGGTDRIESLLPMARAAYAAVAAPARAQRIRFAFVEANALMGVGRYEEVPAACDRIAAAEAPGPAIQAAGCRCTLDASVRYEAGITDCQELVDLRTRAYGPDHPLVARALQGLGMLHARLGHYEEGIALTRRSLAIMRAAYGDAAPTAAALVGLGSALAAADRDAEARDLLEEALRIYERTSDRPTRGLADVHDSLAKRLGRLGDHAGATRHADESLRIAEALLGPDHPDMIAKLLGHGMVLSDDPSRYEDALASFRRGEALARKTLPAGHILIAYHLWGQAKCLVELGRGREAAEAAERGIAIASAARGDPFNLGQLHHIRGRALLLAGDRTGGRRELEAARAIYVTIDGGEAAVAEVDALLRQR